MDGTRSKKRNSKRFRLTHMGGNNCTDHVGKHLFEWQVCTNQRIGFKLSQSSWQKGRIFLQEPSDQTQEQNTRPLDEKVCAPEKVKLSLDLAENCTTDNKTIMNY